MDPTAIAALVAQLITTALQTYSQIQAANASTVPPLSTILAAANADWKAVAVEAKTQTNA